MSFSFIASLYSFGGRRAGDSSPRSWRGAAPAQPDPGTRGAQAACAAAAPCKPPVFWSVPGGLYSAAAPARDAPTPASTPSFFPPMLFCLHLCAALCFPLGLGTRSETGAQPAALAPSWDAHRTPQFLLSAVKVTRGG